MILTFSITFLFSIFIDIFVFVSKLLTSKNINTYRYLSTIIPSLTPPPPKKKYKNTDSVTGDIWIMWRHTYKSSNKYIFTSYNVAWEIICICDVIQQKVNKIGKFVFPNAVEIGRGDCKKHFFFLIKSIDVSEVELWTTFIWSFFWKVRIFGSIDP